MPANHSSLPAGDCRSAMHYKKRIFSKQTREVNDREIRTETLGSVESTAVN